MKGNPCFFKIKEFYPSQPTKFHRIVSDHPTAMGMTMVVALCGWSPFVTTEEVELVGEDDHVEASRWKICQRCEKKYARSQLP